MMLDVKGITLAEVNKRYHPLYQILGYDVLMDNDEFGKPRVISTYEMCVNIIITLLLMKPGQYPSIPDLGIYIEQYLFEYSDDEKPLNKIVNQIYDQCNRIQMTGIEINVFFNKLEPSRHELCVEIRATDFLIHGQDKPPIAIIGISHDKLNQLYIQRYTADQLQITK